MFRFSLFFRDYDGGGRRFWRLNPYIVAGKFELAADRDGILVYWGSRVLLHRAWRGAW